MGERNRTQVPMVGVPCLRNDELVFQQDNCPAHKAKSTNEWFAAWRACIVSVAREQPDFNIIEQ